MIQPALSSVVDLFQARRDASEFAVRAEKRNRNNFGPCRTTATSNDALRSPRQLPLKLEAWALLRADSALDPQSRVIQFP
jgi:hypothetical protein